MDPIIINNLIQTDNVEHYVNEMKFHEKSLNILHINIQSIREKLDEITLLINNISIKYKKIIHIVALSEIWIYENENFLYQIEDYEAFFSNRNGNRSGGCCLYVHSSINAILIEEHEFELSNLLMIKLTKFNINIACIYRYGDSDIERFNNYYEQHILRANRAFIIGDININLKNVDNETLNYIETNQTNGFTTLNSLDHDHFTRKKNSIGTYIDHIFTNLNHEFKVALIDTPISDHRMISVSIKLENDQNETVINSYKQIRILDYNNIDSNIHILENIAKERDFKTFHSKIMDLIKTNTRVTNEKTKLIKKWANNELIQLIDKRNKYYKLKSKYPNSQLYQNEFIKLKVKARNLKNHLKKQHVAKEIETSLNDNRKLWQKINEIVLRKPKRKDNIRYIMHQNTNITDSKEIADIFNEYFINIIQTNDVISQDRMTPTTYDTPFDLGACTSEEVINIISTLNTNSANGYDDISTKFLKRYKDILAEPITRHINQCFKEGIYPDELKIGNVIPICIQKGKQRFVQ